ncbi:MAG: VTT domain-containing protein [Candidatus Aenigmatarchaeota archaeon]
MDALHGFVQWFLAASDWASQLGYLGAFFIGFFSSFTLFLPTPAFAAIFLMAAGGLNPVALGIAAGIGAAVGELVGFGAGYGSRSLFMRAHRHELKKHKAQLARIEQLFQKYKGWLVIFVFAATPLPFDVIGLFCGSIGYSLKKFAAATLAGKVVKYLAISFAGFYGITALSSLSALG